MEEYNCLVRFLDSGGTDERVLSGIIEICARWVMHPFLKGYIGVICLSRIDKGKGDESGFSRGAYMLASFL